MNRPGGTGTWKKESKMKYILISGQLEKEFNSRSAAYEHRKLWGGVVLSEEQNELPQRDEIIRSRLERERERRQWRAECEREAEQKARDDFEARRKKLARRFMDPQYTRPCRDACNEMIQETVALGEWMFEDWPVDRDYDWAVREGASYWHRKNPGRKYPNPTVQSIIENDIEYEERVGQAQKDLDWGSLQKYKEEHPPVFPKRCWMASRGHFPFTEKMVREP